MVLQFAMKNKFHESQLYQKKIFKFKVLRVLTAFHRG